jgi:hypothetical protein
MTQIFISYAHADRQFVERLTHNLGRQGFDVWMDRRSIKGGSDWAKAIEEGIKSSEIFLLCCSEASVVSEWVAKEVELALAIERHIYPLRLEAVDLPDTVRHLQWIDFIDVAFEDAFGILLSVLPQNQGAVPITQWTNPYTSRAMIKDPDVFVGRSVELRNLYSLLAASQCCSIVGPRRIGKSSLLYYLTQPTVYSTYLPDPYPYVFAYVDLQELAGMRPDDFFLAVLERLQRAGKGQLEIDLERDSTLSGFRRFLARATDSGLCLILCTDEFEMLSQNVHFGEDFFTYLRGLCSNYNLALVTASRSSLFDLCHQGNLQTSQFWNIFVERNLELMSEHEARTLITEPFSRLGIEIDEQAIASMLSLAGCHPFFIQIACYHVFDAYTQGGPIDWTAIERQFLDEAHRYYAYAWKQLDAGQQSILTGLLTSNNQAVESGLFHRLKRDALLIGSVEAALFTSDGWRQFVEEQAAGQHSGGLLAKPNPNVMPGSLRVSKSATASQEAIVLDAVENEVLPSKVGRYEVKGAVGRGGMGIVLLAHDPRFKRDIAIKVLPREFLDDPTFRVRFEHEAQTIASLEHPAIVPVYDFGEQDGQPYLVMRLMSGGSLASRLKEGALAVAEAAQIVGRIASALDEVHGRGIVHRDLKPANIMFDQYGDAFLADFGIARMAQGDPDQFSSMIGTPAYMSPEQIYEDKAADSRSDVYALGVILFEMLTGKAPYQANTPSRVMMMHVLEPVPRIISLNPDLSPAVEAIIACAMAKEPSQRYPTAGDMALALAAVARV